MGAITSPCAPDVVTALLRAGAKPLAPDAHGMTFLEYTDLVRRESGPGPFAERVSHCADIAREWIERGA